MSYNGSGTFVINTAGQPVVANTVISATVFNALTADLATGLSTAITKDGQTTITANIPFGSNKITGLGAGTAATDAANLSQVQSTAAKLVTVTGTDTLTGTMSPALGAYAAGQLFYFIAGAANTGAMTINIDGLGAKSITRDGSTALIANDVLSGEIVVICYDGTRFQMINAANSFGNTTINGTLTVTGNAGFQANVSITSALSVGGVFAVTGASTLTGTATLTANPVLSAGTANGVLYLNGSKVATSGSALVFDGSNLGLGVTPSAWNSYKVLQLGAGTSLAGWATDAGTDLSANAFYQTGWKYIATAAAARYQITSTAEHRWHTAASGTAGNAISFTQAMTLDASGRLGIGTTSPASGTRLHMVDSAGCILRLVRTSNRFDLIADTDFLDINARDSGTYLRFLTADTERARITSGGGFQCVNALSVGNATPTTSGAGITFPATQSASTDANTLDDYEEGTWTPSLGGTATYTTQSGTYTKIGRQVTVSCKLQVNAIGTGTTTTFTGLPFTSANADYFGTAYWHTSATALVYLAGGINPSSTTVTLYGATAATGTLASQVVFQNGTIFVFTATYFV
jgi:hypothetical protein